MPIKKHLKNIIEQEYETLLQEVRWPKFSMPKFKFPSYKMRQLAHILLRRKTTWPKLTGDPTKRVQISRGGATNPTFPSSGWSRKRFMQEYSLDAKHYNENSPLIQISINAKAYQPAPEDFFPNWMVGTPRNAQRIAMRKAAESAIDQWIKQNGLPETGMELLELESWLRYGDSNIPHDPNSEFYMDLINNKSTIFNSGYGPGRQRGRAYGSERSEHLDSPEVKPFTQPGFLPKGGILVYLENKYLTNMGPALDKYSSIKDAAARKFVLAAAPRTDFTPVEAMVSFYNSEQANREDLHRARKAVFTEMFRKIEMLKGDRVIRGPKSGIDKDRLNKAFSEFNFQELPVWQTITNLAEHGASGALTATPRAEHNLYYEISKRAKDTLKKMADDITKNSAIEAMRKELEGALDIVDEPLMLSPEHQELTPELQAHMDAQNEFIARIRADLAAVDPAEVAKIGAPEKIGGGLPLPRRSLPSLKSTEEFVSPVDLTVPPRRAQTPEDWKRIEREFFGEPLEVEDVD